MTDKIKDKLSDYMSPTPANMRKLGDASLAVSAVLTTYAAAEEIKWLTITSVLVLTAGKFLTNFFKK